MNDAVWTFEELSRDCDRHYCMADGVEKKEKQAASSQPPEAARLPSPAGLPRSGLPRRRASAARHGGATAARSAGCAATGDTDRRRTSCGGRGRSEPRSGERGSPPPV